MVPVSCDSWFGRKTLCYMYIVAVYLPGRNNQQAKKQYTFLSGLVIVKTSEQFNGVMVECGFAAPLKDCSKFSSQAPAGEQGDRH